MYLLIFTIDDLEIALNFTLISEGLLLNEKSYSEATALKVKLHSISNSSMRKIFLNMIDLLRLMSLFLI
ncbi:MAG: hypothetical protein L6V91_01320 [Bacilli bacterium]|nr:MAG: hypothetical protein L6V91_01320 [Bacilli bacterium]